MTHKRPFLFQTIRLGIIDYILFDSPGAHIPARAEVERIIQETNFTTHSFSDGQVSSNQRRSYDQTTNIRKLSPFTRSTPRGKPTR